MEIRKITNGFVVQRFDSKTGECLGQQFVGEDGVDWEDEIGNSLDVLQDIDVPLDDLEFPMLMIQPEEPKS